MERLLFVCTGNVCRSPMAAAIAADLLNRRGVSVEVGSAGLLAAGRPSTKEAEAVMRRSGLDVSRHQSRQLKSALIPVPDLIITMARQHVRSVAEVRPAVRTLTLKDFVRRAAAREPRKTNESLTDYVWRIASGRRPSDLIGDVTDDIADPIGHPQRVYEQCAAEIETLVESMIDMTWPAQPVTMV